MRLHRFFIHELLEGKKQITITDKDLVHQWKNVFRLKTGDELILLDNTGFEYRGQFLALHKDGADIEILETKDVSGTFHTELYLFVSLIKKDHFEWILEKGTELGVSHFVPTLSDRSEKKDLNIERSEKIIKEAAEQSGRATLPVLHPILSLEDALTSFHIPLLAFHVTGEPFKKENFEKVSAVGALVGPEGGWTPRELELFTSKNIPIYKLGNNQVLRAETAAIAVCALLLL